MKNQKMQLDLHTYTVPSDCETESNDQIRFADQRTRRIGFLKAPVRIKTRTLELKSGFEYTRILFDLGVDPTRWEDFSRDVYRTTKLNGRDEAIIAGTITGFALLGLAGVGVVYGERVHEKRQLKRLMVNRSEGGILAQVLDSWNERYFCEFGVRVWIEVNEAALREQAKKKGEDAPDFVRPKREFKEKTPLVAFNKQQWKSRTEEKKYMVVMSPLDAQEQNGSADEPLPLREAQDPFADPPVYHKSHVDLT